MHALGRVGVEIAPQTLGRSVSAHIDLLAPVARLIQAADTRARPARHRRDRHPRARPRRARGDPHRRDVVLDQCALGELLLLAQRRLRQRARLPRRRARAHRAVRRHQRHQLHRARRRQAPGLLGARAPPLRRGARSGDVLALEALHKIAPLFAIERASTLAGDNADATRSLVASSTAGPSSTTCAPGSTSIAPLIPPKTPLGRALGYLHRQWRRLILFLDDGNIEATNNRRERELRRLVLGRKNWLFTWLDVGGKRTAAILTIVATCIAHDINPRAYLHLVTKLIVNGWPQTPSCASCCPIECWQRTPNSTCGERSALSAIAPPRLRSTPDLSSPQRWLGQRLGYAISAASLTSSSIASRITRSVSSSRCASSSFESARYSGHSVRSETSSARAPAPCCTAGPARGTA